MPGFVTPKEERKHIRRHYLELNEFGVNSAGEYVALATAYSEPPWPRDVEDRERSHDRKHVRFLERCGWYAVLMADRSALLTFHVLHPLGTPGVPIKRTHKFATNREYFDQDLLGRAR